MWLKILTSIKWLFSKDRIPFLIGLLILVLIITNLKTCNSLSNEKKARETETTVYNNNINALNDTISKYHNNTLNSDVYQKLTYLYEDVLDLKSLNKELYNQIYNLKGSLATISSAVKIDIPKLIATTSNDSVVKTDSNTFVIPWNFNYKDAGLYQKIYGKTSFRLLDNNLIGNPYSVIDTNQIKINLSYNFRKENDKYIIEATSPSSIVQFNQLDGALKLDAPTSTTNNTKKNKFFFGPVLNFGLNTDYKGVNYRFGYSVGVGIGYNIF